MSRGVTIGRAACAAALAAAALAISSTSATGGTVTPKSGTYAGAGNMIGDGNYGMHLGFTLATTTVEVTILGFAVPGCSGYTSVPQATLNGRSFATSASNASRDTSLTGRWVKPRKVRGKMVITVPPTTNCGTPGTYTYRYTARRYGSQ